MNKQRRRNYWLHTLPLMCCVFLAHCGGASDKKDAKKDKKAHNMSENIVTLPSGLRYTITKQSNGALPKKGQQVVVHYTGYINPVVNGGPTDVPGQKFDSSLDRGEPFTFPLGAGWVIKGWDEGIALIPVGAEARLYITPELGYGARGAGSVIKPNSHLIFDVQVVAVR